MRRSWPVLGLVTAVVVYGLFGLVAVLGEDDPSAAWRTITAESVGVRLSHPQDWSVRDGAETVTLTGDGVKVTIDAAANPTGLSPREWAAQQLRAGEWNVSEDRVAEADAIVLSRRGERRAYLADRGRLYEIHWEGDGGAFDSWLDRLQVLAPDRPRPGQSPSPHASPPPQAQPRALARDSSPPPAGTGTQLRELSPQEFVDLFYAVDLPGVRAINSTPSITGHEAADARIASLAEARGYRLQAEATADLAAVDGQAVQPDAAQAWRELAAAAAADGFTVDVISGFRSVADQRSIFGSRLGEEGRQRLGREYTDDEIAGGEADAAIDAILETSSIPGYSKHHTGYAVDVRDVGSGLPFTRFGETAAYEWMSADNFANAKRFGFIPSYPHGVDQQGPMPEEWEYVWVGVEALRE